METDTLIKAVKQTSAHPDVLSYLRLTHDTPYTQNFTQTIEQFAKNNQLERIPQIGNPVEKELWKNGVKRLVTQPLGEPYAAVPDTQQKRVFEYIYDQRYTRN